MSAVIDEPRVSGENQHAFAQAAHAGRVCEVRATTMADRLGSHVHVVIHASSTAPRERHAEYLTEDGTIGAALRSGFAIAKAMIVDQVQ